MAHGIEGARWAAEQLMLVVPDSEMADFAQEIAIFCQKHPEVVAALRADQDRLGLAKKAPRVATQLWLANRGPELLGEDARREPPPLVLLAGRPRLAPEVLLFFLVLRGRFGSTTDRGQWGRLCDSLAVRSYLAAYTDRLPRRTTLHENLNAVTNTTRELIFESQLRDALAEGLDDAQMLLGDSTASASMSAWPTDSGLMHKWLRLSYNLGQNLPHFDLPAWSQAGMAEHLEELRQLDFQINLAGGKKGADKQRRKCYRHFYRVAQKLIDRLSAQWDRLAGQVEARLQATRPDRRGPLLRLMMTFTASLEKAQALLEHSADRLAHGASAAPRAEHEELYSVSDEAARFIVKGQRETVFGYKPQLASSRHGLISALRVHQGNVADSVELAPLVEDHIRHTGMVPKTVSFDDGYASAAQREAAMALGVTSVSINGAKGKRQTPVGDWELEPMREARRLRGVTESRISALKRLHSFGQLRRGGLEAVQAELWEKAIAYNFSRTLQLRERASSQAA